MVYGRPDDPHGAPIDFIEAAKLCEVKPDVMRRWLDRPAVRALLHAERRAFRAAICAGNERALQKVRDGSENGMAVIGSVRVLEQLDEDEARQQRGPVQCPGLIVSIITYPGAPPRSVSPGPVTIEHQPEPIAASADEIDAEDRCAAAPVERPAYDHRDRGPVERETREDALARFVKPRR
jgi:hypothetical protein